MRASARPRIKICCISSYDEAELAIRYGAAAVGLVSAMPSGPGVIAEETIAAIAAHVPPGVSTFLLTSLQDASAIAAQHRRRRTNAIQICARLPIGAYNELRRELPGSGVRTDDRLDEAKLAALFDAVRAPAR